MMASRRRDTPRAHSPATVWPQPLPRQKAVQQDRASLGWQGLSFLQICKQIRVFSDWMPSSQLEMPARQTQAVVPLGGGCGMGGPPREVGAEAAKQSQTGGDFRALARNLLASRLGSAVA